MCRQTHKKKAIGIGMELGKWVDASEEVLRSKYAIQTPNRALYNSRQLALCGQDGQQDK